MRKKKINKCSSHKMFLFNVLTRLIFSFIDLTVFEATKARPGDKRKRLRNDDAGDIDGYLGPWGKFVDEKTVMKPNEVSRKEYIF